MPAKDATDIKLGYHLSSEEHGPNELVENAARAEEIGFEFLTVSDHFHPWVPKQGQSPFVWTTLGGIARETERIPVMTFVTCPLIRTHPAIIAQAAATAQVMLRGRFILGLGTGERLNEGVVGAHWPAPDERVAMLEEAVHIIRELWGGEVVNFHGNFYDVEQARIYTRPEEPPAIYIAGAKPRITAVAAALGDGYINSAPDGELVDLFAREGGKGKPTIGKVNVAYAESEDEGAKIAAEWWPHSWASGNLNQELLLPEDFAAVGEANSPEKAKESVACGPDPAGLQKQIDQYAEAGFTHVAVHQYGPDQRGFFDWWEERISAGASSDRHHRSALTA